jgi:hypothetical protein
MAPGCAAADRADLLWLVAARARPASGVPFKRSMSGQAAAGVSADHEEGIMGRCWRSR